MRELHLLSIDPSMELIGQLKEDPLVFFKTFNFSFLPDLPLEYLMTSNLASYTFMVVHFTL